MDQYSKVSSLPSKTIPLVMKTMAFHPC